MTWIDSVLATTDASECPKTFIKWASLVALGAAAKRNIYLSKGVYRVYPNIYCLIIADSGMRKGYAAKTALNLTTPHKFIRTISGSTTIQRIIQNMGKPIANVDGSRNDKDGSAFLLSGEFTNLIKSDRQAMTWLTELYDACYNDKWTYDTKGAGTDELYNVVVSLLGATTKEHFNHYFDAKDVSGGFLARTIIVTASQIERLNAAVDDDEAPEVNFAPLSQKLLDVARLPPDSKMKLTAAAKTCYKSWYEDFFQPANLKRVADKTGFVMRSHDHVLKVAMLLSLSRDLSLEITDGDIEEAIDEVFASARDIKAILFGRPDDESRSPLGMHSKNVLEALLNAPGYEMDRRKVLQKFWGQFDSNALNQIVQTMEESGWITTVHTGTKVTYRAMQSTIEAYLTLKARKEK